MRLKSLLRPESKGMQVLITLGLSMLFIIPQISQQLIKDKLPATGDLIHRRAIYLITNFPNFDPPVLISSHSQFYHYFISYFNIFVDLTGNLAFYGMTIINLLLLPVAALTILILARRINPRWALFAPILFLSNTNLVLPFFGHTDQHLIYTFFGLLIFIIINLPSSISSKIIATLLLGITFNSSIAIWLVLIFILLLFEKYRPEYRPLFIGIFALLLYLPFITPPISYLAFNDYSGTLSSLPLLLKILVAAFVFLLLIYRILRNHPKIKKYIIIYGGTIVPLLFFVIKRSTGPFSGNLKPELIESAKATFIASFNLIEQIFVINPNKGLAGFEIYVPIVLLIVILGVIAMTQFKVKKNTHLRIIVWIICIPIILALFRLVFFLLSFQYSTQTALYQLHPGRILLISFFLLPLALIYLIPLIKPILLRIGLIIISLILLINITFISYYSANRIYPNFTQQSYQQMLQSFIVEGNNTSLSPPEGLYSCEFYQHCSVQFTGGRF